MTFSGRLQCAWLIFISVLYIQNEWNKALIQLQRSFKLNGRSLEILVNWKNQREVREVEGERWHHIVKTLCTGRMSDFFFFFF